jgi:hypothetical protein
VKLPADPIARIAQVTAPGCLVIVVICMVITAWFASEPRYHGESGQPASAPSASQPLATRQTDIKVVSWSWHWEPEKSFESGTVIPATIWVEGDVQNVSQHVLSNVGISLDFYDAQGGLVKHKSGTIDSDRSQDRTKEWDTLIPGQTRHFTIDFDWPYEAPAKAEITVGADPLS